MSHMISSVDGRIEMAYAGEKPWHKLGIQVPGLMTTQEALKLAHLDWTVEKLQVFDNFLQPIQGAFGVHRMDNKSCLGIVGNQYNPINNVDAFAFFDNLLGSTQGQIETAAALDIGQRVFMMAKLPDVMEVVSGDVCHKYLLVHNSHDGSSNLEVMFTNIRVVCNNTLTMAIRKTSNKIKIRHTTNAEARIKEAEKTLLASQKYWDVLKDACVKLASTSVTRVEVGSFIDVMFPVDETKKERKNSAKEKMEELVETAIGNDIKGVKDTAWGLFNAYTEYLDHHAVVKSGGDRWERSVFGANANKRQQAFDYLMTNVA